MIAGPIKICDIDALCKPNCKIKDPERVERIINELVNGGAEKLQLVSDFDFTITKQKNENGDKALSSFCIIDACKSLPSAYVSASEKLSQKYKPIEVNPHIPVPEKIKAMIEWYTLCGELLQGFPLGETEIDELAIQLKNSLRDGTHNLFQDLHKLNVPILVFSAGLGNAVVSVLKQANLMLPNVKVISNFLQYKNGLLNGFDNDKIIHTFNKNETVLKGTDYYDLVRDRDHIILMGDSLGDANMADGVPSSSNILKIGFLLHNVEINLPIYMDTFDIVLLNDQTMNVARTILSLISPMK